MNFRRIGAISLIIIGCLGAAILPAGANHRGSARFTTGNYTATEEASTVQIALARFRRLATGRTLYCSTGTEGTATPGVDYRTVTNQAVRFRAQQRVGYCTIELIDDPEPESVETIELILQGQEGVFRASTLLTIIDGDHPVPTPSPGARVPNPPFMLDPPVVDPVVAPPVVDPPVVDPPVVDPPVVDPPPVDPPPVDPPPVDPPPTCGFPRGLTCEASDTGKSQGKGPDS